MKYFERLAVTSYFLIGSLGETKLSYMDIDELKGWFDDLSTNGLKIDGLTTGAGNVPTGNGKTEGYQLIVTPDILMQHIKTCLPALTQQNLLVAISQLCSPSHN